MLTELRERVATYLAAHEVCVVRAGGGGEVCATPACYRSRGLALECLLPRWADLAFHVEGHPRVTVLILDPGTGGRRWLQGRGTARPVATPDWGAFLPEHTDVVHPGDLYLVLRVTLERIDLVDERRGWGRRENLDMDAG